MYRGHTSGVLSFDDNVMDLKFVTTDDGHLIAPVMVVCFDAMNTVLFAPEEDDDAIQLLLTLEELGGIDFDSADTDRWRVYHGEPVDVRWAKLWVESAKLGPVVFDGEALATPNRFASVVSTWCRELNADSARLRALCEKTVHVDVEAPTAVGLDPDGIDVRARFGVIRVPFDQSLESTDDIESAIAGLLA
jgi:hypothetical protein